MARITEHQIEQAYIVAAQVYDKQISTTEGANLLHQHYAINFTSARDYINDYKQMMLGAVFQRAMSAPAIDFFLCKIKEDKGSSVHKTAIQSVNLHIEYYEGLGKGRLLKMRGVVEKHTKNISSNYFEGLYDQVVIALKDSKATRLGRISAAKKKPEKRLVTLEVYTRDPNIIAQALLEANGICGKCNIAAPFLRKRDNTPYLEVHHKIPLSLEGEDTLENVIALCPNCHRESHFG